MSELSIFRLHVLRIGYALIAVGLTFMIVPRIIWPGDNVPHMNGVVRSLLGGVCVLSYVGIRYPIKMLPVMFFELAWKVIWIVAFGLPLWRVGGLEGDTLETMSNCILGVIVVAIVVPWGYVLQQYVKEAGEPWFTGSEGKQ